jgi:hypothetical protein
MKSAKITTEAIAKRCCKADREIKAGDYELEAAGKEPDG